MPKKPSRKKKIKRSSTQSALSCPQQKSCQTTSLPRSRRVPTGEIDVHPDAEVGGQYDHPIVRDTDKVKYKMELNGRQAKIIEMALELYARMLIGQMNFPIQDLFMSRLIEKDIDPQKLGSELEKVRQRIFPEFPPNASYGICGPDTDDRAQIAWDIQQVLRNRLSWDRVCNPKGDRWKMGLTTVNFDDPMKTSEEPLCSMEEIQNGDEGDKTGS